MRFSQLAPKAVNPPLALPKGGDASNKTILPPEVIY
jgi:hypothetical protein